ETAATARPEATAPTAGSRGATGTGRASWAMPRTAMVHRQAACDPLAPSWSLGADGARQGSWALLRVSVDVVVLEVEEVATPQANLLRLLLGLFGRPLIYEDTPNHPECPNPVPRPTVDEEREDSRVTGRLEERLDLLVFGGR